MENNQEKMDGSLTTKEKGTALVSTENVNSDLNSVMEIAKLIAKTPMLSSPFEESVEVKDENGVALLDENGEKIYKNVVNISAIATCIMLGRELGFSDFKSISLGKRLDTKAVIKCEIGKDLGLSPMSSINNIYIISNKIGNETVYTNIHVINKVLTDCRVKREIIEDGTKTVFVYKGVIGDLKGIFVDYDPETCVIINAPNSPNKSELDDLIKKGIIPVIRIPTRRAIVKLTRGEESIAVPYSLIDATEAGLYPGTNSRGDKVEGKDNWKNHPATMLRKMSIMLGARTIVSDRLNGIYDADELPQVKVSKLQDVDNIQDVEIVE